MKILVLNGVNINMVGRRGPMYGRRTLGDIENEIKDFAEKRGADIEFFQSNIEGEIVDRIQRGGFDGLIINAGAYSHYSYAIADALECCSAKKVEVHLTNILAREPFRAVSVTAKHCDGCITGLDAEGYILAAEYLLWRK